jgi:urea transport system ATP-binding protein
MAIVLVEQYLEFAAELADEFIILERGRVVATGSGNELAESEEAKELLAI